MAESLNHPHHHDISDMSRYAGGTVYKFLMAEGDDQSGRLFLSYHSDGDAKTKAEALLATGRYTLVTVSRIDVPEDYPASRAQYTSVWSGAAK